MKSIRTGFIIFSLFFTVCLIAFVVQLIQMPGKYVQVLDEAFSREVEAVQTITGAIIAAHPEYESEIAGILREENLELKALGREALQKYGFTSELALKDISTYVSMQEKWYFQGLLFSVTGGSLVLLCVMFFIFTKKKQTLKVIDIVESYLSEDFSFSSSPFPLGQSNRSGTYNRLGHVLKQLGQQIQLKSQRLTQEKESTKSLVTDISHQLKTPIASLQTSFALSMEVDSLEEQKEFQHRCGIQINKLESLVASLMNISRMETGMIIFQPRLADLQEILIAAFEAVFNKMEAKNIAIEMDVPEGIILTLDERWTCEAIVNVLDNAIKYSPPNTTIQIHVEKFINFVRIEIADEGIGISKTDRSKIFQRFYRGSDDLVRASEGSGVGLFLSRFILEEQGGSISVRDGLKGGSVFVLQLRA